MSNPLRPDDDFALEAYLHVPTQLRDKENFIHTAAPFIAQLLEVETALIALRDERTVDAAVGVQLDGLGAIVGQDRGALDDDEYRAVIRAKIQANNSDSTPENLLRVATLAIPDVTWSISEQYPAGVLMSSDGISATAVDDDVVLALFRLAKAAGVKLQYRFDSTATPFTFSSQSGVVEADAALGFANAAQTVGGDFSGVKE